MLDLVIVRDRGMFFYSSAPGDLIGFEEHCLSQCSLAGASVAQEGNVSDVVGIVGLHSLFPYVKIMGRTYGKSYVAILTFVMLHLSDPEVHPTVLLPICILGALHHRTGLSETLSAQSSGRYAL